MSVDVNLAAQLLKDAHPKRLQAAAVISNDSDLEMPITVVRQELGYPVWLLSPRKRRGVKLRQVATYFRKIRQGVPQESQFPPHAD